MVATPPWVYENLKILIIKVGKDVGVHHQKGVVQIVNQGQGADGSHGPRFKRVIELHPKFGAVPQNKPGSGQPCSPRPR